jgi:hypothetical protein
MVAAGFSFRMGLMVLASGEDGQCPNVVSGQLRLDLLRQAAKTRARSSDPVVREGFQISGLETASTFPSRIVLQF